MGRILAIDYGSKKIGLAATDPLQLIVNAIDTIRTSDLDAFLESYIEEEEVEKIVLGEPLKADGSPGDIHHLIIGFKRKFEKKYPAIPVVLHDEYGTSKQAKEVLFQVKKKKDRRNKKLVDQISAVLILQDYLGHY